MADKSRHRLRFVLAFCVGFLVCATTTSAQITNGNFEFGDLSSWTTGGIGHVEALQAGNFTPTITPPEGSWFALLSSGPGDGGGTPADLDGNGTNDDDISTLSITFNVTNAPQPLGFRWAFLTSEIGEAAQYDDFFEVRLDGNLVLAHSSAKPGGVSPYADSPPVDGAGRTVNSAGPTDNSNFQNGVTAFNQFCLDITTNGNHTIVFTMADQGDAAFDSGLLVDDVALPAVACGATNVVNQITQSDDGLVEAKGGGLEFTSVQNGQVAATTDGKVLVFASNGDYTGDNPNGIDQLFVYETNTFTRLTAATSGDVDMPAITSDGTFVTFESTADLTPGSPGNADGNREIFRCQRSNCLTSVLQVTDTTSCENRQPTISGNGTGRRIAFSTTCTDLTGAFNADGNREVVLWDSTGPSFQINETTGCTNQQPSIARHNNGQYVSFVSDCDLTGGNGDGNDEIFLWDRTGGFTQVTNSTGNTANDSPSTDFNGTFVAFVSDGDYTGANAVGNRVTYRWARVGSSFVQLSPQSATSLDLLTSIDDSGANVAISRLGLLDASFNIYLIDAGLPLTLSPVVTGDTAPSDFPSAFLNGVTPGVAFQSNGDFSTTNGDGNSEIWTGVPGTPVPPVVVTRCRNTVRAIPDNNPSGVDDTLSVVDTGTILDLDVSMVISHTFVGDLIVTLENVTTGTTITLIDRPGTTGVGNGCRRNNIDAILSDEASTPVEGVCSGTPAISGTFSPNELLSTFDGLSVTGDWILNVSDNRSGDAGGTLNEWCLIATLGS